jgi:RNA-binding protein
VPAAQADNVAARHCPPPKADGDFSCFLTALGAYCADMSMLTNAKIRELKARAQLMKPTLKVGHDGLSEQFITALDEALKHHDLVKVKFSDHKEEKKTLAPQLAEKTGSELIMRVGNVAVLYRAKPVEEKAVEKVVDSGDEVDS